ncbi:TD and POZ domain-containing protein 4-like [Parasteatoda tepidariorum]|uniref:TD and POZ domain-containing protein 4-like n=1 Tax=Parasteatoda tepidariorum TaxID=114398 RepID=UPI0039BD21B9
MSTEKSGECFFIWKIRNFSGWNRKRLSSSMFTLDELNNSQWQIILKNDENWIVYCTEDKNIIFNKKDALSKDVPSSFNLVTLGNQTQDALTIQCRIKSHELENAKPSRSAALTTVNADRSSSAWDVILKVLCAESVIFSILNTYQFKVTLSYAIETVDIIIKLRDPPAQKRLSIKFEITILNKMGSALNSKRTSFWIPASYEYKFPDFITMHHLEACKTEQDKYEVKLKCDVNVDFGSYSSSFIQEFSFSPPLNLESKPVSCCSISALRSDFENIFISKKNSDVIIRAEKEKFFAHKFILRTRSPVFDTMFEQNMLENQSNVVDIVDMDAKTVNDFLKFLYTGTVDIMDLESAKKLLLAADKYHVPSLVDECANFMKPIISVINVCEIISIADLVNCKSLKLNALQFIRGNAAEVLLTTAWSDLMNKNINLASFILSNLSSDILKKYQEMK